MAKRNYRQVLWRTAVVGLWTFSLLAADVASMSGTWRLNLANSKWGKHPKPASIEVTIQHHEPAFRYDGNVVSPNGVNGNAGENGLTFAFNGAIDGKDYPVTGSLGAGQMNIRRVNTNTIESEYKSSEGNLTETARTTISSDGKTLTQEMEEKGSKGTVHWTEVYDRQ